MTKPKHKAYRFSPLSEYSFFERQKVRTIGWLGYVLTYLTCLTLRFEVEGSDYLDAGGSSSSTPIVCSWHENIVTSTYFMRGRGLAVMSSISYDAEYTARIIQRFGFGIIKGSSTRGGTRGLIEMIRLMESGIPSAFTVDGPRGPRYEVKPGPPLLAKRTGEPMLPFSTEVKRFIPIRSWDRLRIPVPFSAAKAYFGTPIFVDKNADDEELERKRLELQNALLDISRKGDEWASRG